MPGKRKVTLTLFLVIFGTLALDSLLFRTGPYAHFLEPDSSTGLFEAILRREQQAQLTPRDDLVVTLGNSRFAYSRKVIDHLPRKPAYEFRDAGIAGSNARNWYYMLRDLDPSAQRYRAVVLGVDDYDDEDRAYSPDNEIRDLHYVIARLRFADIGEFARSFTDPQLRWTVFRDSLFKGLVYQTDFHAFLSHPAKRIDYVRLADRDGASWRYDYVESDRTMVGLNIDWATLAVTWPPGADDGQRESVTSFLAHPPDPQTGRLAAYRRLWLGKIIDRYRGSRTRVIFVALPRGPIPRPNGLVGKKSSSIREMAAQPGVLLANEHAFDALERPEYFRDGMHLNRQGIERFSAMLPDEVERLLVNPN